MTTIKNVISFTEIMRSATIVLASILFFAFSGSTVFASDDRVEHFKGKLPTSIAEAKFNLSVYNHKMADILAKDKISPKDMAQIHVITYTIENALGHLASELNKLQNNLEKIHLASEHNDIKSIREITPSYLFTSNQLFD